ARPTGPPEAVGPTLIAELAAWFQAVHHEAKEPVMPAWFREHERHRAERRQAGELLQPLFAQPYPYENHPLAPAWLREHERRCHDAAGADELLARREHERKLADEWQSVRSLR